MRATTPNQSDAQETTMSVAGAPITPPDTLISDRVIPLKDVDDEDTVTI